MANPTSFPGDVIVPGSLTVRGALNIGTPANASPAGMQHEHRDGYEQPNTAATTETRVRATIRGATGTIKSFVAGSIAIAVGVAVVTIDLQKSSGGGAFASVLSAPITLDTGNTAGVPEAASIASASVTANDVLRVVVTSTPGGGTAPTGVFAETRWVEDYSG